jgi:hypothetical protein
MQLNFYNKALVIVAVGIFYTNVPEYMFDNFQWQLLEAPKHWILLLCLFSLPTLLNRNARTNTFTSPIMIWCLCYAAVTVIWFVPSLQSETSWLEVRTHFFTVIMLLIFLIIFEQDGAARLARKMVAGGVLLAVALNIYESFVPLSFSPIHGRSAGLYTNPSWSGEALVLGMILSVTALESRYRGLYITLTGIGVLTTLSRGCILAWGLAVAGLIVVRGISPKDLLQQVFLCIVLGILVVLPQWDNLLTSWERSGALNSNVLTRLEWFTDPSGVSDHSSWERKYLVEQAWDNIGESPILGKGTGWSRHAAIPPHNQFLSFMLEHGVLGVIILPLLMLAAAWGARGESKYIAIVFSFAFMTLSLFSHTILNTAYSLLPISLLAAMCQSQKSLSTVPDERRMNRTAQRAGFSPALN